MRLLVTRPQPQADDWVSRLSALGVDAAALPLLGIEGPTDAQAVRRAWATLGTQRLVMFVSPSAVQHFFALRPDARPWPGAVLAGGTGPGSAAALHRAGVPPGCVVCPAADSPSFDSEALWLLLRERVDWRGASALIVRGEGGRDWLAQALTARGAAVHFVEAYRRAAPILDEAALGLLAAAQALPLAHVWLFSSSQAVHHLPALAPEGRWRESSALATHARIAHSACEIGFGRVIQVLPTPSAVAAQWTRSIQSQGS